jgi:hypothetical protein
MVLHALTQLILLLLGAPFLEVDKISKNLPQSVDNKNGIFDEFGKDLLVVFAQFIRLHCGVYCLNEIN